MDVEVDAKDGPSLPESEAPRADGAVRVRAFAPLLSAAARTVPEDFAVDERHGPDDAGAPTLDGAGEHLWLHVRKRLLTTDEVATALAARFGVPARQVGHSGMKDRRAVTTQWFSVCTTGARVPVPPTPDAPDAPGALVAGAVPGARITSATSTAGGWEILSSGRHSRKLRRGTHSGNRFRIVLRDPSWEPAAAADPGAALRERAEAVRADGFANRFGPQRFGRGGANVAQALAMFAEADRRGAGRDGGRGRGPGRGRERGGRHRTATRRGLLLSAARSAAFNAVLDERVRRGDWRTPLDGEPLVLAGSGSFFVPDGADDPGGAAGPAGRTLADRLCEGDVSTSGPMPGVGEAAARGACAALEAALIETDPTLARLVAGLACADVAGARRALVARAPDLVVDVEAAEHGKGERVVLTFTLAPGVFATALLEAFGDIRDAPAGVPHCAP